MFARIRTWLVTVVGFVILTFGLGCLNYTKHTTWDHHVARASEHGIPGPSYGIFVAGVASLAVGAGVFGFLVGRRVGQRS